MITTETVMVDGRERVSKFVVTGPLQFRAELPGCLRDECAAGQLTPCIKSDGHIETVNAWLKHIKTHCHGWHLPKVEAFAAAAEKTVEAYGLRIEVDANGNAVRVTSPWGLEAVE